MNIFQLVKGANFDYDQVKEKNVFEIFKFFVSDHLNVGKHAVDCIKQNPKCTFEAVVLLGGTNDLTHKSSQSEDVFKELKQASDSLSELENVNKAFLCKVPPRLDNEAVDVNELNCQITNHAIAKNSNQLLIINSVNRECKNFNKYGLDFSQVGMQHMKAILLKSLYSALKQG